APKVRITERGWRQRKFMQVMDKFWTRTRVRINLINELINSERSYLNYLSLTFELYYEPLKNRKKALSKEELDGIFGNIPLLINLNRVILQDMENVIREGRTTELGRVFGKLVPFLKM